MIRKTFGAIACLVLGATSAQSTIIRVDFTISSDAWMRTQGGALPYGLSDNPVVTGSVALDTTKSGADVFVGLDYTAGNHTFSLSDINATYSYVDFELYNRGWGGPLFMMYLTGENGVSNANSATIEQNWNAIVCNNCVSSTFQVRPDAPAGPVPEPASWAMMIGGFGLVGTALRRR